MRAMRLAVLHLARSLGLFALARRRTRGGLRILCYHGFAYADEHRFKPRLFMSPDTFAERLDTIVRLGLRVAPLDEAVAALRAGTAMRDTVVITADDGWQGTEDLALPLLASRRFPWTLYLTSYYAAKGTQVMNVALQYLCWKSPCAELDLAAVDGRLSGTLPLGGDRERERAAERLAEIAGTLDGAEARQAFVRAAAAALRVDNAAIEAKRMFHLVGAHSLRRMMQRGADIQLHTHRHHLHGRSREALDREIDDNRAFIEAATGRRPVHFCYPSGIYEDAHPAWLAAHGIVSATTCRSGFNYPQTPVMELRRFLDGEHIAAIEFEAELSGFLEVARQVRARLVGSRRGAAAVTEAAAGTA